MADNNTHKKVFKLPRHLLAVIANNNQQAIKALENLEVEVGVSLPEQIELLKDTTERLDSETAGAVAIALNAFAVAQQALENANNGYLGAVAVAECADSYLVAVQTH